MNTKKITILLMFFMGMLTANAGGPSACVDWNGYVDSKNTSGTGYITLEPGQEEKAAQTYQYTGPGKINQVRVIRKLPLYHWRCAIAGECIQCRWQWKTYFYT
jgi:hypothetical protein